jgi:hypothetical protein
VIRTVCRSASETHAVYVRLLLLLLWLMARQASAFTMHLTCPMIVIWHPEQQPECSGAEHKTVKDVAAMSRSWHQSICFEAHGPAAVSRRLTVEEHAPPTKRSHRKHSQQVGHYVKGTALHMGGGFNRGSSPPYQTEGTVIGCVR